MAGVRPVHGHAADRVLEHDVVDDWLQRDRLRDPGRDGRGARRRDEIGAPAANLDELGEDRQRDLLGGLGTDVEAARGPQCGDPFVPDGRLLAQPLADDTGAGGRRDE
jgi:hypothetical protein